MTTTPFPNPQEEIIRKYLGVFVAGNVNGMLQHIHPAIHYERYIGGKAETVDNGTDNFKNFLEQSAVGMDTNSLQLLHLETDNDQVDIRFRVITSEPYHSAEHAMQGSARFWFMDEMILQLVVQLDTEH